MPLYSIAMGQAHIALVEDSWDALVPNIKTWQVGRISQLHFAASKIIVNSNLHSLAFPVDPITIFHFHGKAMMIVCLVFLLTPSIKLIRQQYWNHFVTEPAEPSKSHRRQKE
eukprot:TRINITY_DN3632_c0_g2_i5.p1 TRINITY_DN3632_c0_g2~~TRINITY_DN3632_c0_g2_i5.p1  ORF type:complete len:112 (-),score=10.52 TRINITY_DN3632_c0_g2_i5:4-339(-)